MRRLGRKEGETADEYIDRLLIGYAARQSELNLLRRAFNATRYGGVKWEQGDEVARAFSVVGRTLRAVGHD